MKSGVALAAVGVAGISMAKVGSTFAGDSEEAAAQGVPADYAEAQSQDLAALTPGSSGLDPALPGHPPAPPVEGIDVSNHNGDVDWNRVFAAGRRFAFVLASDGDNFRNTRFDAQYTSAKDAGLLTGAYHFGRPTDSAIVQADLLLGTARYVADGRTLPPVLDLEVDPNSGGCYGRSSGEMHEWISTFVDRVKVGTGRDAIIYASPTFWNTCMGGSPAFNTHPLWLASYDVPTPTLPGGWKAYTFWQYSDNGSVDGVSGDVDVNRFNGGFDQLRKLAAR